MANIWNETNEMQLTRLGTMPRLAWVVHVSPEGDVKATVGDWVESGPGYLMEGAWNGDFADSYSFMGSGVIVEPGGRVLAVAPCNTTEGIYSLSGEAGTHVSNSLALLLSASAHDLDITYLDYEADAMSIAAGLGRNVARIPLAGGAAAAVHYYCNVVVTPSGTTELPKPLPGIPVNYQEYRRFLIQQTQGVAANAADPGRRVQYPPIVFCSAGYDSAACAVLGREVGCEEAVVYESKRTSRSDAGTEVVRALGYTTVHRKDENDYRDVGAAELFLGTGELATSLFFSSSAEELTGKLLISGIWGDSMWERQFWEIESALVKAEVKLFRYVYPDTAKKEFRLKFGYINYTPAFLTAMIQQEIHLISSLPEMEPWTLHSDYDRPIVRRLAEEAGVPRDAFGMVKNGGAGTSLRFGNRSYLARKMPPESFERFSSYLDAVKGERRKDAKWMRRAVAYLAYVLVYLLVLHGPAVLEKWLRYDMWATQGSWRFWYGRHTCSPFAPSLLFPWAIHELRSTAYSGLGDLQPAMGADTSPEAADGVAATSVDP